MLSKNLKNMIDYSNNVRKNAYTPISNFPIGACIKTPGGEFYTGCNIENISFPMGICAESAAIANMVSNGDQEIESIVVVAEHVEECSPCGACRQRIYEFSSPNTKVYLCSKEGSLYKEIGIQMLLFEPFKFKAK